MNYQLRGLTIGYGRTQIATHLDATLEGGKLTCLLGPNGAGKSTLLRTLSAFQPALAGHLHFVQTATEATSADSKSLPTDPDWQDKPLSELSSHQLSTLLGVVLTERVDVHGMTVRDLVAMGRSPYTNFWGGLSPADNALVDSAIARCHIESLSSRQISTLSDGERQKVMIAKTLAQQTPIILLDEPTAFLDFPSKVETMLLLASLAHDEGKAILISTHDLDLALQTADTLWLMGKGEQMQIGTPRQLADNETLPRFFRGPNVRFDNEALRFTIQQ